MLLNKSISPLHHRLLQTQGQAQRQRTPTQRPQKRQGAREIQAQQQVGFKQLLVILMPDKT